MVDIKSVGIWLIHIVIRQTTACEADTPNPVSLEPKVNVGLVNSQVAYSSPHPFGVAK